MEKEILHFDRFPARRRGLNTSLARVTQLDFCRFDPAQGNWYVSSGQAPSPIIGGAWSPKVVTATDLRLTFRW
jgi:hypothetical protein